MFSKIIFPLITFFVLLSSVGFSQLEFPEDKVKAVYSVEQNGCDAVIVAAVTIVPGWHINAMKLPAGSFLYPTGITFKKSTSFELRGGPVEPKPHYMRDELADEDLFYHEGTVKFKQKIKILDKNDFSINGAFDFQTCNDVKCLPNHTFDFDVKIRGCSANKEALIEIPAKNIDEQKLVERAQGEDKVETKSVEDKKEMSSPEDGVDDFTQEGESIEEETVREEKKMAASLPMDLADDGDSESNSKSLWMIFFLAFASGFAALLTPCVFPMIPMTVSFFTKQSKTKSEGIRNALIYGLSIIGIYILLGTAVTAIFGAEALNEMSTNPWFNIIFFLVLAIFAISFLGAFEIRLPSSWANKVDSKADKGGLIGIFFMALALAIVSFSCTGPIVGTLLVQAASEGGVAPFVGMFGFSLALALPFGLFAAFPGWMNSLPKSGGWLNTVKVVLGFLELALAFKFLSNADLAWDAHYIERELFLAIWIGLFGALAMYLFGWIRMPHDSPLEKLSVGRALFGTTVLIFVIYMIPGMFGAPLKLISAFPPPSQYSESPLGFGGGGGTSSNQEHAEGMHLGPQNIMVFHDYDLAKAHAEKVGKPLFVDFTGKNCVNCRKMEMSVWSESGILETLQNDVVIASLHVDDRVRLPESEIRTVEIQEGRMKTLKTVGDLWMYKQIKDYKVTAQPFYVMIGPKGEDLSNGSADFEHHSNPADFKAWLDEGLKLYKEAK